MKIKRPFSIKGVGKYMPEVILSSKEMEAKHNFPEGYIFKNVGVKSRHIATKESLTSMAREALTEALNDAKMSIKDIDCLIAASTSFDYIIPSRSALIKNSFGDQVNGADFPCIDMSTICTSFITAIDYASLLLSNDEYTNIAIVSSEISSKNLNPDDKESYGLFGDGAAAIVISKTSENAGLIKYNSKTYPDGVKYTIIEGGGHINHPSEVSYNRELYSFKMHGKKLLKEAKSILPSFLSNFYNPLNISMKDIDLIVPHQTSKLGFRMLKSLNNGNNQNIVNQLEQYGNCIAASIPIALVSSIQDQKLNEGETCFLVGTAAGITVSGMLFKYSKI